MTYATLLDLIKRAGQQEIPPQQAYEPEQATAAFEPQSEDEDEEINFCVATVKKSDLIKK